MNSAETARHALYSRLQEVLGEENAATLMSSLPPEPIARLATQDDIQVLAAEQGQMRIRLDRVERSLEALTEEVRGIHTALREQLRTYTMINLAAMTALTGVVGGLLAAFR